ncbi:MAG TPA: hypothetical protein VLF87_00435 [Patescibacteria group bacterium]|nr:hypothetical protein [Patescibacteria group bacterium]
MPPLILLGLLVGLPLVASILLRIKPLYLFVSIVTGYFLVSFLGDTAELTFTSIVHVSHPDVVIRLILLLLPVVITWLLMRKTLSAAALPFQFVLLVGDSLLLAAFVLPLLTSGTQGAIYATHVGSIARQAQDVLVAGVAVLHVLVMWIMRPRHQDGHHGKKHH